MADGVGGWAEYGVDPSIFSNKLVENCKFVFDQNPARNSRNLKQLGVNAVNLTREIGTSTLLLLALDPHHNILYTNYLGDSGYLIMRKFEGVFKTIFKSKEQQKQFNFPI